MPNKIVNVMCPFCQRIFSVGIDTKYKGAQAIPQGNDSPKDEGIDMACPKCPHQLFIRYM